jgi:hypothetical protein
MPGVSGDWDRQGLGVRITAAASLTALLSEQFSEKIGLLAYSSGQQDQRTVRQGYGVTAGQLLCR